MKKTNKRITPEVVTELSRCEIFVFGSNLEGQHYGGAARTAYEKFGAKWGVGDGPTGRCYAMLTMFKNIEDIRPYAEKFIDYAKAHPQNRFLLTRVGCGIAGFDDIDMAELFQDCMDVPNITYPKEWLAGMLIDVTLGLKIPKGRDEAPKVITDDTLEQLCRKYQYQTGAGINDLVPRVKVRYVLDRNKFGYAYLGDFFFHNGQFFVWDTDDKWAGEHDQKAVLDTFGDECFGRGYAHKAIFAGVQTNYKDCKGEYIFTGDVISLKLNGGGKPYTFALGTLGYGKQNGRYAFMLDNHSLFPENCFSSKTKMTRIGTVFFRLDKNAPQKTVAMRAYSFNMNLTEKDIVLMAKYTPNFDQEKWKYQALEIMGVKFNWNK